MAGAADELMLLERVFLRLGSAETDDQLQNVLCKFLPPVLLKLSSTQEGVRKKVMELLIHVNKRVKTRPMVQLPVEALLTQYQDPSATSFVINFTIIYIKLGFPRLPIEKQAKLVPTILVSLENKPTSHVDGLLLLIIPLLGKVKVPTDPQKIGSLFGLNEKPVIAKNLLSILLDVLLLPYGALTSPTTEDQPNNVSLPVPPGMSEFSFKRIVANNPLKPEQLEEMKLGIVKFLAHGVFANEDCLVHMIVAAADTRFSVANLADSELKKIAGQISGTKASLQLQQLFLGMQNKNTKPEDKKSPACTRIRLKILTYLVRLNGENFCFGPSMVMVFNSLYGTNTNSRLKTLALNYVNNMIRDATDEALSPVAAILLSGLIKQIKEGEEAHQGQCYVLIGLLAHRFPKTVYNNVELLEMYFSNLEAANSDVNLLIRDGLLHLIGALKYDDVEEQDQGNRLNLIFGLIGSKLKSEKAMVRFVTVRSLATIFPAEHVPSKYLLLLSIEDPKEEVSSEAFKSLYGTSRRAEINLKIGEKSVQLPNFAQFAKYVHKQSQSDKILSNEVLLYMRLCMLKDLDVPLTREVLKHPCEHSPLIANYLNGKSEDLEALEHYADMCRQYLLKQPNLETIGCMVELIGCCTKLHVKLLQDLQFLQDLLGNTKEEVRESAALLYALVINQTNTKEAEFDQIVQVLLKNTEDRRLEKQHGSILAVGTVIGTKLMLKQAMNSNVLQQAVQKCIALLKEQNAPLIQSAACSSLSNIGRHSALPLENGKVDKIGSPDAKKPAIETVTKIDVVTLLTDLTNNSKVSTKIREKSALTLGLLCVGEQFPHTKEVMQGFLTKAKETKDVEVHFTVGEALVMCCQSIWSPEARNPWTTTPDKCKQQEFDANLPWLLEELLQLAKVTHPNSRQASCIWLLAVIKSCGETQIIGDKVSEIQQIFMDLLCENNDIVQDTASKGLCVLYDIYKKEELLSGLMKQLMSGASNVAKVTSDTKLFEDGQLGTTPTGGKLTTYRELCSLASDLNKPDLVYKFMHLANHNNMWNSKKGAAFGFSTIAEKCGEDLQPYLAQIIPKIYRYQYDPTPSLQASMQNIWHVLVPEPSKCLDLYYDEILADILDHINSNEYKVRQACCLALQDFLKGSPNRCIHDAVNSMPEIWKKLFRVMDDHHEQTRLTATKTAKILSKLCIKGCDISQGKQGIKMVEAILPELLNTGIIHTVSEIRWLSLQTVAELVTSAGKQLKPFLPKLIPALLQAAGETENVKLSYLSTMYGGQSQVQEAVDSARASFAKSHFTTETVSKSLQYADSTILEELVPKIVDLLKGSVGLGTRVACAHFINLLVVQIGQDIQPYTGKLLAVLVNGLTDRNSEIRKQYANTIGHLVKSAKDSSLDKLFDKLKLWYFEREDDSIRSACAYTIQSIGTHNQEILTCYSTTVLPLVFFAMHAEKSQETQRTLDIWNEIWSEQSPGTETGIRQNIEQICDVLKTALESPSWTMKAQAANSVTTVANKLGQTMENKHRNALINILLIGLPGRTWNGKDKLLKALASICSNCKDSLINQSEIDLNTIVEAALKESRKEELVYKNAALQSLAEIVSALEIDRFDEIYQIVHSIVDGQSTNKDDEDFSSEELVKQRETVIKIKETAYETLGKAWPLKSKQTQEKYRELFVEHTVKCLPTITRSIQVSVMSALYLYVDKLILLQDSKLTDDETDSLRRIMGNIIKSLEYTLVINKYTRLRKESLNVVLCLAQKLQENPKSDAFEQLSAMFEKLLPELSNDAQPEIKTRLTDIKKLMANK